jgi:hypothetical protein
MTTPIAACIEFEPHGLSVKQEQSASVQTEAPKNYQHMAASSIDTQWSSLQGIPRYGNGYASALSDDHNPLTWASNSDAGFMATQNHNYQLETAPDHIDTGAYAGWPGSSCNPTQPSHSSHLSPINDPGRPRTFPPMDVAPMLTGFTNTIAPHELYRDGPPRSDPYQYADDREIYTLQNVCDSVEKSTSLQQIQFGYYGQHDDRPSYRSTPCEEDVSMDEEDGIEGEKHEPYAKSLFRCLRDAPAHTMVLRDIYEWFKTNTARGKDQHEKGWQNSIRHNLSMNKVRL